MVPITAKRQKIEQRIENVFALCYPCHRFHVHRMDSKKCGGHKSDACPEVHPQDQCVDQKTDEDVQKHIVQVIQEWFKPNEGVFGFKGQKRQWNVGFVNDPIGKK